MRGGTETETVMVSVASPPFRVGGDLRLCLPGDEGYDAGTMRCASNLKYLAEGGHNLVIVDEKVSLS